MSGLLIRCSLKMDPLALAKESIEKDEKLYHKEEEEEKRWLRRDASDGITADALNQRTMKKRKIIQEVNSAYGEH